MLRVTDLTLPIICLQTAGRITREDIESVRPVYDKAYARGRPFLCISDARLAKHDAQQRALWAEWSAYSAQHDPGLTRATIIILDNPLLRGALTALNWLACHKIPQHPCADVLDAIEIARRNVEKEGMVCKPETWGEIRVWLERGRAQVVSPG